MKTKGFMVLLVLIVSGHAYLGAQTSWESDIELTMPRMNGPEIMALQEQLIFLGYAEVGEADGWYGPKTEKAVKLFQYDHGRKITGIVDQVLYDAILSSSPSTRKAAYLDPGSRSIQSAFFDFEANRSGFSKLSFLRQIDPVTNQWSHWVLEESLSGNREEPYSYSIRLTIYFTDQSIRTMEILDTNMAENWSMHSFFYFYNNGNLALKQTELVLQGLSDIGGDRDLDSLIVDTKVYFDAQGREYQYLIFHRDSKTLSVLNSVPNYTVDIERSSQNINQLIEELEFEAPFNEYF